MPLAAFAFASRHVHGDPIQVHLDYARKAIESGHYRLAAAHADIVLMPESLRISIDDKQIDAATAERCEKALSVAASKWEEALDHEIKFEIVPRGEPAEFKVAFINQANFDDEPVAGTAEWSRSVFATNDSNFEYRIRANVEIGTRTLSGDLVPDDSMVQVAMHEIGHVFGLDDSHKRGLLMSPIRTNHPILSPAPSELEKIRALRREAFELKARAELQSISNLAKYNSMHETS